MRPPCKRKTEGSNPFLGHQTISRSIALTISRVGGGVTARSNIGEKHVVSNLTGTYNMSRSFKKTPGYKDRDPFMKNYANRRVRRKSVTYVIANGKAYRKESCSYDICDHLWLHHTGRHRFYRQCKKWDLKSWQYYYK